MWRDTIKPLAYTMYHHPELRLALTESKYMDRPIDGADDFAIWLSQNQSNKLRNILAVLLFAIELRGVPSND